jgi:chromosome segregation ATPase
LSVLDALTAAAAGAAGVAVTVLGGRSVRRAAARKAHAEAAGAEIDAIDHLTRLVAGMAEQISQLQQRLAATEIRSAATEMRASTAEARVASAEAEVAGLRAEVGRLQSLLAEQDRTISALRTHLVHLIPPEPDSPD